MAAHADDKSFPPVPKWRPSFMAPLDNQLDRLIYYTNGKRDIAQFRNGTMVILEDNLDDKKACKFALDTLSTIFNYHPDINPVSMDDGNILVQYNQPAYNVVIAAFADHHRAEIEQHHLEALARDEVLITPLGPNAFDYFAMQALYGRTFMFMDAQDPAIVRIHRH